MQITSVRGRDPRAPRQEAPEFPEIFAWERRLQWDPMPRRSQDYMTIARENGDLYLNYNGTRAQVDEEILRDKVHGIPNIDEGEIWLVGDYILQHIIDILSNEVRAYCAEGLTVPRDILERMLANADNA